MKIKFATPEMAAFTGMHGSIEFADGVSVSHVTEADVRLYSAITTIEVIDQDFAPDLSYDEVKNLAAVSTSLPTLTELMALEAAGQTAEPAAAPIPPAVLYTHEQLEAVADKEGITGVRAIADPMNIKGTSISKLIAAILAAQTPFVAAAGFIESPAEGVSLTITDSLVSPSDVVAAAITEAASA